MDRLRIGVIGLGWFGEIHCETIAGIPNLELAALCTRRPERLAEQAGKFGVKKTYTDYRDMLADKDIDAVSIVTMWDQHTEPAVDAAQGRKARLPRKADGLDGRRLQQDHRRLEGSRRASCRSATSAASIRATAWRSRRSTKAASARSWRCSRAATFRPPGRRPSSKRSAPSSAMRSTTPTSCCGSPATAWRVPMRRPSVCGTSSIPTSARPCTASRAAPRRRSKPSGACRRRRPSTSTSACRSSAPRASSTSRTPSPISASSTADRLHSPDTTYWPMFDGVRGGALRAEFEYFANCALKGITPAIGRPEDAAAALEATLAAEESARTGNVVRIG